MTNSPSAVRASAPQATKTAASRWAVGTGRPARPASAVRVIRRWSSSKAPTSASARLVTEAPGAEELPATRSVFHLRLHRWAGTVDRASTASTAATENA